MRRALLDGLGTALGHTRLALFLLGVNALLASVLAVPLAMTLEKDLKDTASAGGMMRGFDYPWWSHWAGEQRGWPSSFAPDIFGKGFAFKNLEALLGGELPARLFVHDTEGAPRAHPPRSIAFDPVILALGLAYMVVQTFLAGGILGALRGSGAGLTTRGFLHGSAFYFGRMARIALLALLADAALFALNAPIARFVDRRALEAATETAALAWSFGHKGLLLLGILFVHMLSGYAKVVTVLEERRSAALAFLSSAGFCLGRWRRTFGHYLAVAALGVALLAVWSVLDTRWNATGYRTLIVTLVLAQGLVYGRIVLRLALLAGQVSLYRRASGA